MTHMDGVDPTLWPSMGSLRTALEGRGSAISQVILAEWRAFLLEMGTSASADGKWKWTADICDDRGSGIRRVARLVVTIIFA